MKVSLLGTGLLGSAIAERLLSKGHHLIVWNRTRGKAEALRQHGAQVAATPAEAIDNSEVTLTVLRDGPVTIDVLLAETVRPQLTGQTIVQMGTIGVEESKELKAAIEADGGSYLETPVLGSTPEAKAGELIVMAAGPEELYRRLLPLLADMGESPRFVGEIGKAASLKLALNQLLVGIVGSFGLSLGMVRAAGVPNEVFMEIVRGSSLRSPQIEKKYPRMMDRDFSDPHFPVSHILKDIELMLAESERLGLGAEALEGLQAVVERTLEMGYVTVDYSALYNGIHPPEQAMD